MGALILRPQGREQSQVIIKEYKGNLRRGVSSLASFQYLLRVQTQLMELPLVFSVPLRWLVRERVTGAFGLCILAAA